MDDRAVELANGAFATLVAVLFGLIDQGAVHREKLRDFLSALIAEMSEGDRAQPYGMLLQRLVLVLANPATPTPKQMLH
jgi:hypothetical protein